MSRRFKIVDSRGRTFNCPTHTLDEAARALLDARERGERIQVRRGDGRALSSGEAERIVARAVELAS